MRIGHGYDVHGFTDGDQVVLGGVSIPFNHAFKAHSDGDVLIHALIDSLLGALALGDIGQHFPDTDPQYKDCDSRALLVQVQKMMVAKHYQLSNADTRSSPTSQNGSLPAQMRANLAEDLNCTTDAINIKATTTEKLGYIGRGEGIACHALVLLSQTEASS